MFTAFSVVSEDTKLFRIELRNLSADLETTSIVNCYFECNFDNYRSWTTPKAVSGTNQQPSWDDYKRIFVYETLHADNMVVKLFTLSLYGTRFGELDARPEFVGEAVVDLLTLARGPRQLSLSLMDGDAFAGRVDFILEMFEMCETRAAVNTFTVSLTEQINYNDITVQVHKRNRQGYWTCQATESSPSSATFAECPDHFFCSTWSSMMEENGLLFEIYPPGLFSSLIGTGSILFREFLHGMNSASAAFDFQAPVHDSEGKEIGEVRGNMDLTGLPLFCQMYAGVTVDGVVCGGQVYRQDQPLPPFVEGGVSLAAVV